MTRMQPTLYRIAAILTVGAIALGTIAVVGCGGGGGDDGTFGEVRGRVLDNDWNALQGATVRCGGGNARTDDSGRFTISNARSGNQTVTASMTGYFDAGEGSKQVNVPPGGSVNADELFLVPRTQNNQYIYVSDINPTARERVNIDQQRVVLDGVDYLDGLLWGLSTYNDSSLGEDSGLVRYSLARQYTRLEGVVGIEDNEDDANAMVTLRIMADGDEIWRSNQMGLNTDAVNLDLDVTDVSLLELRWYHVDGSDHASLTIGWGDLKLKIAN